MLKFFIVFLFFWMQSPVMAYNCVGSLRHQFGGDKALTSLEERMKSKFPNSEARVDEVLEILGASNIEVSLCCEGGNLEAAIAKLLEEADRDRPNAAVFSDRAILLLDGFEQMQYREFSERRGQIPLPVETIKEKAVLSAATLPSELLANTLYSVEFERENPAFRGLQKFRFSPKVTAFLKDPLNSGAAAKFLAALRKGIVSSTGESGIKRLTAAKSAAWEIKIMGTGTRQRLQMSHSNGVWDVEDIEYHK